jgi:hypothetical protein
LLYIMIMDPNEKYLPTDLPKELPEEASHQNPHDIHDIKTLLSWSAPGRPYKKHSKKFYINALLLMIPIQIILFLFSQYLLMIVVLALVFMAFSFSLVPPKSFHYRISSEGVRVEDHFYIWPELYDFYFKTHEGMETLYIRTVDLLPGALIISLGDIDKEHVKQALLPYVPYREVIKTNFMDKSSDWLSRTFPLEPNA